MSTTTLPPSASVRLSPDERSTSNHIVVIKADRRREPFAGVTRMTITAEGLTLARVAAISRALTSDFVVTLHCADPDVACDVYLDAVDLLAAARAAAWAAPLPAVGAA